MTNNFIIFLALARSLSSEQEAQSACLIYEESIKVIAIQRRNAITRTGHSSFVSTLEVMKHKDMLSTSSKADSKHRMRYKHLHTKDLFITISPLSK